MEQTATKKHVLLAGTVALICISFGAIAFGLESLQKTKYPNGQIPSITVTGEGEVTAKPDIATVSFNVYETAKSVPEAQKAVEAKIVAALKELKTLDVDEKDIKTNSYSVNPQYENQVCNGYVCPAYNPKIIGYQVNQSVTVKIRKVDQAGEVFGLLGKVNVGDISGPNFTVDDMDKLEKEAKDQAIKKAQEKAKVTAKSLGMSLGSVTMFNDDQGGYYPAMYRANTMSVAAESFDAGAKVSLPQGENVIKVRVSITYSLK